ncbi:uncharacterized protein LA080_006030 [Diaporthe eres]|nr:uncharacterized protein LA080_006030 [Diaporthe eres]
MGVSVTITCSRRQGRPAELRIRNDQILRRPSQPPTPHPNGLCPVQQPLEHAYFRHREFLRYRYVSERRVYTYPRARHAEADATDRRKASVQHRSAAGRGYAQQVTPREEQDIQTRRAEQNAKIKQRPGVDYTVDEKPKKKVRFRPDVYKDDELTKAVRNLRLDERSGRHDSRGRQPRQSVGGPNYKTASRRRSTN